MSTMLRPLVRRQWRCVAAASASTATHKCGSSGWSALSSSTSSRVRCYAAAGGASGGGAGGQPGLVTASGAPLQAASATKGEEAAELGPEMELNAQNAGQLLQSPGAFLLQVGELPEAILKKLKKLRKAAGGRLALVRLDCGRLPQICQALQVKSQPCMFLMARGQVAAALEEEMSGQAATTFVERVAQLLGLKVGDLGSGANELLEEAEELEWSDAAGAYKAFEAASNSNAADLTTEARVRIAAGAARCHLRTGQREEAEREIKELENGGHQRLAEVKQAMAMLRLDGLRPSAAVEELKAAAEAAPDDAEAGSAYVAGLFWAQQEGKAIDAVLELVRKKRSDEKVRKLALALVEALGPRHPRFKTARRSLNNTLFV
eukprot:TRINITY_DN37964_c0_g1_i1.p1 TRINITY_DN37964_c0_g1~~TRINITY_DN37964_c0_g1_i1.p1  ORF type:complete len:400 (+),score=118.43 TRINITY_DN37964_c0_g1_i1:72-1202(+)